MTRTVLIVAVLLTGLLGTHVRGDLVIDFLARDEATKEVTGPVSTGTLLLVDVLISVTGTDNPQEDVRLIQLDFSSTSPKLELLAFTWKLDPGVSDSFYSPLGGLPEPSIFYRQSSSTEGFILNLDDVPQLVATVELTVNGSGTLTVQSLSPEVPTSGTVVSVSFTEPRLFSSTDGNISGGTLSLQVIADDIIDSDGDGTIDLQDDFPTDSNEQFDTDDDGTGNNSDDDDDNDGTPDEADDLPLDASEGVDTDGDGIGNSTDNDDDGDGVMDEEDAFPQDPDRTDEGDGGHSGNGNGNSDSGNGHSGSENGSSGGGGTTFCGAGMVMPFFFILIGLTSLRIRRNLRNL